MVGPSLSGEDYEAGLSKVQVVVVGLVALSGLLVAAYADAGPTLLAAGGLGGALIGYVLWRYLRWAYRDATADSDGGSYEKRERFD